MNIENLNVSKARKAIVSVKTLDALHELRTQEMSNTKHSGGRKSILQALEEKRQELLEEWRKSQVSNRKVPIAMVGNLIDDFGTRIPKGQVVTGVSQSRLEFFVKIRGVEYHELSSESSS